VRALPRKDCCRPLRIAFTGANSESRYSTLERAMPKAATIPGKKVSQGSDTAFVPAHRPPELDWKPRLMSAPIGRGSPGGKISGRRRRLPNPHILIRPFLQREAVLSSKIEGTQATLGEVLAAEAGAIVDHSPEDLREVGNYVFRRKLHGNS
jgi:hypothetical protein